MCCYWIYGYYEHKSGVWRMYETRQLDTVQGLCFLVIGIKYYNKLIFVDKDCTDNHDLYKGSIDCRIDIITYYKLFFKNKRTTECTRSTLLFLKDLLRRGVDHLYFWFPRGLRKHTMTLKAVQETTLNLPPGSLLLSHSCPQLVSCE